MSVDGHLMHRMAMPASLLVVSLVCLNFQYKCRCPARYRAATGPCTWKAEGPGNAPVLSGAHAIVHMRGHSATGRLHESRGGIYIVPALLADDARLKLHFSLCACGTAGVGDSHIEGAAAEDKDRQPWSRQCIGERSGGPGSGSQQSSGLRGGL